MRRSDHPSRPRARICCCLVSSKTLLMPATELAFRPDVNVSIATGNGRFSTVDQWPVLGVHRGQFASWLWLTPREHSSGQPRHLSGISKRGDVFLRCLLTHG